MKKIHLYLLLAATALLTGCSTVNDTPVMETHVVVTPSTSEDIFLIVTKPVSDTDDSYDPSQGVVLPIGKFLLESEDINYWYFKAPKPLVLALYEFGHQTNGMRIAGGVALRKTNADPAQPLAYMYTDDTTRNGKILLWHTTKEFAKNRGDKWRLSTDSSTPVAAPTK